MSRTREGPGLHTHPVRSCSAEAEALNCASALRAAPLLLARRGPDTMECSAPWRAASCHLQERLHVTYEAPPDSAADTTSALQAQASATGMPPRKLQLVEPSQEPFSSGFVLPPPVAPPSSSGFNASVLAGACASLAVVLVLLATVAVFACRRTRCQASRAGMKEQEVSSPTQRIELPSSVPAHACAHLPNRSSKHK
jgi:hypothetical protein